MKIARVETYPLLYPLREPYGDANGYKAYRTCYLIRITTESGAAGWGECVDWLPTLEKGFHERIIPFLIGQHALARQQLVRTIHKWHQRAAAAVSMALTEIAARAANLSVCELWGGRWPDTVPVYASFQSYRERPDWMEQSLRQVEAAVAEGFNRLKVKIGGRTLREDKEHVRRLLQLLPAHVQLALDANQSYDGATAREWQRIFAEGANWMWVEEPLPLDRVAEYRLLRQTLTVPIAGGENLADAPSFLPLLREGALDLFQPDPQHTDGLDNYCRILRMARDFGYRASPHAYDGALSRLYALFAQACLPPWSKMAGAEVEPVEWDAMENPFTRLVPLSVKGGEVRLPDGPGIGMELDEEMIGKYRWDGRTYA